MCVSSTYFVVLVFLYFYWSSSQILASLGEYWFCCLLFFYLKYQQSHYCFWKSYFLSPVWRINFILSSWIKFWLCPETYVSLMILATRNCFPNIKLYSLSPKSNLGKKNSKKCIIHTKTRNQPKSNQRNKLFSNLWFWVQISMHVTRFFLVSTTRSTFCKWPESCCR